MAEFKVFKEEFGKNVTICDMIQNRISLCKDELETFISKCDSISYFKEDSYCWFRNDGINKIILMNPIGHL